MRTENQIQATAHISEVKIEHGQVILSGTFRLAAAVPEHDADLPKKVEHAIERGGQEIKRQLFRQTLERLDLELLLAQRAGKDGRGFQRRGSKRYPFKTIFGTVTIQRRRVQHRADGSWTIPSAVAWQTPEHLCVTAGLKAATCDSMMNQSAAKTEACLAERANEEGLLSKSEVLQIVHEEGERLQAAQQQRAEQVLRKDATAASLLVPAEEAEADNDEETDDDTIEEVEVELTNEEPTEGGPAAGDPQAPLGFPGSLAPAEEVARQQPRQVDPDWVIVEPDEVKVHAQGDPQQKYWLVYTAAVLILGRRWYLSAATAAALQRQVAGLLASLGVHQGKRRLLFLADGARWIRNWFEGLALEGKAMILCWYHLAKRCEQGLSMACRGREHRRIVEEAVLGHLWHGRVAEALAVLQDRRGEMKNEKALDDLLGYLEQRQPYIPDYEARRQAGLWIASNRVEKLNDWTVSARCKHQGMAWTLPGVSALAALEAAQHQGELATWRETGRLPDWKGSLAGRQAA